MLLYFICAPAFWNAVANAVFRLFVRMNTKIDDDMQFIILLNLRRPVTLDSCISVLFWAKSSLLSKAVRLLRTDVFNYDQNIINFHSKYISLEFIDRSINCASNNIRRSVLGILSRTLYVTAVIMALTFSNRVVPFNGIYNIGNEK